MHRAALSLIAICAIACGDDDAATSPPRACDGKDNDGDGTVDDMQPPCVACELTKLTSGSTDVQRSSIVAFGSTLAAVYEDGADSTGAIRLAIHEARDAATPMPITVAEMPAGMPSAIASGGDLWVAWQDGREGAPEIYVAQFGRDGSRKSPPTRVTTTAAPSITPKLASAAGRLGVVWEEQGERTHVYFASIGQSGVMGPFVVDGGAMGSAAQPAIAGDGNGFLVVWSDDRHGDRELYARRTTAGGDLGEEIRITNAGGFSEAPAIAPRPSGFGIAFIDAREHTDGDLFFVETDAAGMPRGEPQQLTDMPGGTFLPAIATGGGAFLIAWNDLRMSHDEIYVATLTKDGMLRAASDVSGRTDASGYPSIAYDGSGFVLAWYDGRGGSNELYSVRLGTNGYCF